MKISKVNFTFRQIQLLISMLNIEDTRCMSKYTIANKCKIAASTPYYYKIMDILLEDEVIKIAKRVNNSDLIQIDRKALHKYINEQEITKYWISYFDTHHILI